ncbi:MetQ/NlpA family ABC transporter substrate-binding protein [Terrilactibacillus sp. S3-3]|nr:MetQ/NlpA family ABC transporter substrate-binding protein [Terrilactibacillus sp. S3-3]
MRTFNKEKKADLVPVLHIPSVRAGIFSNKHESIKQIQNGAKIAIPQDPSNAARAYHLLQKAGWITLKKGVNPILATKDDIESNPRHLTIIQMDSAQIPRALSDVDFGVLPGSIVYAAHIDPEKALLSETLVKDLEITVAVDKKNRDKKWVKAIVSAYQSKTFKNYISEHNHNHYWVIPDDLK